MKELKRDLKKAQGAVASLLEYFPQHEESELNLVVRAGIALDKLEDRLKTLWGKDWGK